MALTTDIETAPPVSSITRGDVPSNTRDSCQEIEQTPLPPTDQGKAAWLVLAGCSIIQAPVWGFSLSFGIFQEYYMTLPGLKGDKSSIASIGTSASGILYLSAPLTFTLLTRYPHLRPLCSPLGLFVSTTALIISSFSTRVWHLIATQGVLCALGCGFLYSPTTLYLDEWWISRKGLAYGVMLGSKSLAGVGLPFLTQVLLERYGFRITIRAWAVASLIVTIPPLYFLHPRIPIPRSRPTNPQPLSLSFLQHPAFWTYQTSNVIQSLGYFLPTIYLSSYARSINLTPTTSTLLLALLNLTSIPGSLAIGLLNDRTHVTAAIAISALGSAVSVFLFWGLADQVGPLAVFALLYGFFAGGYSATWSGMMTSLKRDDPAVETGMVFGLLAGGRGVGNVACGVVSGKLVEVGGGKSGGQYGYGTQYEWVIVFTGVSALLGGWGSGWRVLRGLGK